MPAIHLSDSQDPTVVTVDVGTSSVRALVYDGLGRRIEGLESHAPNRAVASASAEIDPDQLIEAVLHSLDALHSRLAASPVPRPTQVAAVAVSTFWHSLMGVDAEGRAATPLYNWNDTRAAAVIPKLRGVIDEARLHARTGCVLHASYWPAKLVWLRESQPQTFARVTRWMSIGEYLHLRLFGRALCSISMASATGLLNQNQANWDEETLELIDIGRDRIGELGDIPTDARVLAPDVRARWPLFAGAQWFPALGDGACNNIGSGCLTRDRAALMIGTSGALRIAWKGDAVKIPGGLWCYRADRRRFVMGGALSNGGNLFEWMRDTLKLGSIEDVESKMAAMDADAHGLTMLPFLAGERSTGWRADARAAIIGLSSDTRPVDILRAGLEAVAYRFAAVYDLLVKEAGEPRELIASGAALLRSPVWAQLISDVIGKPMVVSGESEASSRGAALLALEALGVISDLEDLEAPSGRIHAPDPERHSRYVRARRRQDDLYAALDRSGQLAAPVTRRQRTGKPE